MFKCLVSGGCSFSYGFNLPDRNTRYAKLLADHMGVELIDVSASGMTNEFIAAATIIGVNKALLKYKPNEILVVHGWTSTERFEFFNPDTGNVGTGYTNPFHHRHGDQKQKDKDRSDFIRKNLWSHAYGHYKLITSFISLSSYCEVNNIKIIHKLNVNSPYAKLPNISKPHSMVCNKDYNNFFLTGKYLSEFEMLCRSKSFADITSKKIYHLKPGVDTHPNALGNKIWAERLIRKHPEFSNLSSKE